MAGLPAQDRNPLARISVTRRSLKGAGFAAAASPGTQLGPDSHDSDSGGRRLRWKHLGRPAARVAILGNAAGTTARAFGVTLHVLDPRAAYLAALSQLQA